MFNFSELRYSRPVFFSFFVFMFFFLLRKGKLKEKFPLIIRTNFYWFLALSLFCVPFTKFYTLDGRYYGFVGTPTVFSGILAMLFSVVAIQIRNLKLYFFIWFLVFFLVYISGTRLVLIFLLIHPLLNLLILKRKMFSIKKIFLSVFLVTLFLYPSYQVAVEYFPQFVKIRYEHGRDSSFGFRFYLYSLVKEDFISGKPKNIIFGNGAEYSRLFVLKKTGEDHFPHNDYMRILSDFGILGFLLFVIIFYKISTKNKYTLNISIIYMLMFYSNMVYSLFFMILLLFYYLNDPDEYNNK
jgi:O-antigen ligase